MKFDVDAVWGADADRNTWTVSCHGACQMSDALLKIRSETADTNIS